MGFFKKLKRIGRAVKKASKAAKIAFHIEILTEPEVAPKPKKKRVLTTSEQPALAGPKTEVSAPKIIESQIVPTTPKSLPEPRIYEMEGFWAYLDSFLKSQNSIHTQRAYEQDLVDFLSYIKTTSKPVNIHSLTDYREALTKRQSARTGKPLSHVSINRKMATVKSFLNWLVINGMMPNNPARAIKSFRAGRESPTRDISNDMVQRMLEQPDSHSIAGRLHHAILSVLFFLGLRRSELIGLRTSDIFEIDGTPVIRVRGKGDKERVLPLPRHVSDSIFAYLRAARRDRADSQGGLTQGSLSLDEPLFMPQKNNVTKVKEKALHPNTITYVVKYYAKAAGVPYRVSPHSARATAVSNALDNFAPHRAVQYMAGWSSPLMVTRYDKRKQDLRNSAVRFVKYENDVIPSTIDARTEQTP